MNHEERYKEMYEKKIKRVTDDKCIRDYLNCGNCPKIKECECKDKVIFK